MTTQEKIQDTADHLALVAFRAAIGGPRKDLNRLFLQLQVELGEVIKAYLSLTAGGDDGQGSTELLKKQATLFMASCSILLQHAAQSGEAAAELAESMQYEIARLLADPDPVGVLPVVEMDRRIADVAILTGRVMSESSHKLYETQYMMFIALQYAVSRLLLTDSTLAEPLTCYSDSQHRKLERLTAIVGLVQDSESVRQVA